MAFHHAESPSQIITASYSILLSPTYRVPVLYICLYGILSHGLKSIHAAYQYLVPESSQEELSTIGVMGGLSMTVSEACQIVQLNTNENRTTQLPMSRAISSIHAKPQRQWKS